MSGFGQALHLLPKRLSHDSNLLWHFFQMLRDIIDDIPTDRISKNTRSNWINLVLLQNRSKQGYPQMLGFLFHHGGKTARDIVDHCREKMSATPSDDDDAASAQLCSPSPGQGGRPARGRRRQEEEER